MVDECVIIAPPFDTIDVSDYDKEKSMFDDYMELSSLCETLAEEIGLGNITVSEANRIIRGKKQSIEEIYFGDPVTYEEHISIHSDTAE